MTHKPYLFLAFVLSLIFYLKLATGTAHAQSFTEIKPSPQQVEWQDLEFGVLIHYGPNSFMDREWGDGKADPKVFNPTQLDVEQWMRAIQDAGAKYVVLVAKHHDGFCLWPTEQTEYSVKSSPWQNGKGDLVRQVSDAAKKYGLKFGVYMSPWDRHEPRYANSADYDDYYIRNWMNWFSTMATWWSSGSTARAAADMCTTFRAWLTNSVSISQMRWSSPTWHCSNMETSDGWETSMASFLTKTGMSSTGTAIYDGARGV
jgi:alpha-L-fucosidase